MPLLLLQVAGPSVVDRDFETKYLARLVANVGLYGINLVRDPGQVPLQVGQRSVPVDALDPRNLAA